MKIWLGWKSLLWLFFPVVLWWMLQSVPLREILRNFQRLQIWQLLMLVLINLLILLLFSARWWLILRSQGFRLPYLTLAGYRLAGFSISYFTPGTQFGGEPLLVYALRQRHAVPAPQALAAVALDKLIEVLVNFSFLGLGMIFIVKGKLLEGWNLVPILPAMAALLGLPLLYLLALISGRKPAAWALGMLSGIRRDRERLFQARQVIYAAEKQAADYCRKNAGRVLGFYLFSWFVWVLMAGEYWLTLAFLGLPIRFDQALTALLAARLALLVPIPGGLGTLEASQIVALQALGFEPAIGASIALLIRGRDVFFAGIGLWLSGLVIQKSSRVGGNQLKKEYSS